MMATTTTRMIVTGEMMSYRDVGAREPKLIPLGAPSRAATLSIVVERLGTANRVEGREAPAAC